MKTKKLWGAWLLLLMGMMLSLSACDFREDDPWSRDDTDYLASRTWVDEWTDAYGTYYRQELDFYGDGTGEDYVYSEDGKGYARETRSRFTWYWNGRYSLRMRYGDYDYSTFDISSMGGNSLEGWLDGTEVFFRGR